MQYATDSMRLRGTRCTRRSCVVQGEDSIKRCSLGRRVESRGSMESSSTELSPPNGYKQWFGTRWVGKGFEYMYIYLPGLLKVVPYHNIYKVLFVIAACMYQLYCGETLIGWFE